jgi:hypothetical protein
MAGNTTIQIKRSGDVGNTPNTSIINYGELALNYADGLLFYKNSLGQIKSIKTQDVFESINIGGSLLVPTSPSDVLTINSANGIVLSACTTTDTIIIGENLSPLINISSNQANAAYGQANTANATAQAAFNQANTANTTAQSGFNKANTANTTAQAAFDKANTYPGNSNQVLYKNSSNVLTSSSGLVYDGVSLKVNGNLESTFQSGDEGGEIFLNKSVNNTTLTTGVSIDVYQNKLRFFETGGSNRGVYIDMANGAAGGIGTNLLSPTGGTVTSVAGATGVVSNTQLIVGIQTVSSSYGITFDYVATANNGQGTNFKVGDDAWIGDYNTADSIKIKGQQNAANGYISFGSNTSQLGAAGSGQLTYGGNIVWHAGNDGAGSGLDADLLDGLNSSQFAKVFVEAHANAAFNQANTAGDAAQSAFDKANTANTTAQSAFDKGNTANIIAQAGFNQANTANVTAQAGFNQANTANTLAQAGYNQANTANTTAESAFNQANTANVTAQAGFNQANTANVTAQAGFNQANTANTTAQSAFDKANTAVFNLADYFPIGDYGYLYEPMTRTFGDELNQILYDLKNEPVTPRGYFLIKDFGYLA